MAVVVVGVIKKDQPQMKREKVVKKQKAKSRTFTYT